MQTLQDFKDNFTDEDNIIIQGALLLIALFCFCPDKTTMINRAFGWKN